MLGSLEILAVLVLGGNCNFCKKRFEVASCNLGNWLIFNKIVAAQNKIKLGIIIE